MAVVRAAGGLLWRDGRKGRSGARLAVIHRPHRKDWSLPKGKLDDGETWEACALREVREETGCEGRIASFAGAMSYVPRNNPKLVLYWHMEMTREGKLEAKFKNEIDEVAWLTPEEALARLEYAGERRIVERFPEGLIHPVRSQSPREAREAGLFAEVLALRADLLRRVTSLGNDDHASGLGPALDLVAAAEDAAANGRTEEARLLVAAVRRMSFLSLQEPERSLRARLLLEQATALAPPSRRAIRELLAGEKPSAEAIYLAAEVRDEAQAASAAQPASVAPPVSTTQPVSKTEPVPTTQPVLTAPTKGNAAKASVVWVVLGAAVGLAVLGLGVASMGAYRAILAVAAVTSAAMGGAAGLLASRRWRRAERALSGQRE
jgi:8-oxo-dGTP diphosphatase